MPERVVLYKMDGMKNDYESGLSDGYDMPAIVARCPLSRRFREYQGLNEDREEVSGIDFGSCLGCEFFDGLDSNNEVVCRYMLKRGGYDGTRI